MVCFSNAHEVIQGIVEWPQIGVYFLHQIAGQEAQAFARLHCRTGQHQPLHGFALQGVNGACHGQPGFACACRAYAEGDVMAQDVVEVLALARRARA
jgi:hypothetical protein